MNLSVWEDPLNVLTTTRVVVKKSKNVSLNLSALEEINPKIVERIRRGLGEASLNYGAPRKF